MRCPEPDGGAQRLRHHVFHLRDGQRHDWRAEAHAGRDSSWPPGLPVFGQLTPFTGHPLYERLEKAGRSRDRSTGSTLRPSRWTRTLKMTIKEARAEFDRDGSASYSPDRNAEALHSIGHAPIRFPLSHDSAPLFRGIYFPQMNQRAC